MPKTRVLIADDHTILREGLRALLGYTLVGHYFPLFEGLYVTKEKPAVAQDALQPAPVY